MNKRIFLVLLMGLLLFPLVMAKPIFYLEDKNKVKVCQGDMASLTIFLKNEDNFPSNFSLKVEGRKREWVSFAPHKVHLNGGDSVPVFLFVTPSKLASEGNYTFRLIAYNNMHNVSEEFYIQVENCHKFKIIAEKEIEGCLNESVEFPVYIKNEGKYQDNVNLKVAIRGTNQSKSFNLTLPSQDTEAVKLRFTPKKRGNYSFYYRLQVKGLEGYREEETTTFIVRNCAGASIELERLPSRSCIGESSTILFKVRNTGNKRDIFSFSSSQLNITTPEVSLKEGEEFELVTSYIPKNVSNKVILKVTSKNGFSANKSFIIKSKICCATSLISPPEEINVCKGEMAQLDVKLSLFNNGPSATYTINSQSAWIYPQLRKINLNKGEEKEFFARIKIPEEAGKYHSIITATSGECEDKAHLSLNVIDCYSFNSSMHAKTEECACSLGKARLEIKNTGKVRDTYRVVLLKPYFAKVGDFAFRAGEVKNITIPYNTSCEDVGKESIVVKISSLANPLLSTLKEVNITTKQCYGFEVESPRKLDLCGNETQSIEVYIRNTGTSTDNFTLVPFCPPWVKAHEEKVELKGGETKIIIYNVTAPLSNGKEAFCSFKVHSEKGNSTKMSSTLLSLLPVDECFCFNASLTQRNITFEGSNKTNQLVDLKVENCGRSLEEFSLAILGELKEYVSFKPERLTILPSHFGIFHIAISKPLEGEKGRVDIQLIAERSHEKETFEIYLR